MSIIIGNKVAIEVIVVVIVLQMLVKDFFRIVVTVMMVEVIKVEVEIKDKG